MDTLPIIIIGAATALLEVVDLIDAINAEKKRYTIIGALDDNAALHNTAVEGIPVLGGLSLAKTLPETTQFVFAISAYRLRIKRIDIFTALSLPRERFATLIHPRADISKTATLGHGCTVYSYSYIAPKAVLEDFSIVYSQAFISAHARLCEFSMVGGQAFIGANATLEPGAFAGAKSCLSERRTMGRGAMLGLNSTSYANIPANTIFVTPNAFLKSMDVIDAAAC